MTVDKVETPGFAGGGFAALAGRGHAVAGCAPRIAHPAEQRTSSGAAHTPVGETDSLVQLDVILSYVLHVRLRKVADTTGSSSVLQRLPGQLMTT